jgi:hypothetical protein
MVIKAGKWQIVWCFLVGRIVESPYTTGISVPGNAESRIGFAYSHVAIFPEGPEGRCPSAYNQVLRCL